MCSEYRMAITNLFKQKSTDIIPNTKPEHTAVLLDVLFQTATERVLIFSKNLAKEAFGLTFVKKSVADALARGVYIDVILEEPVPEVEEYLHSPYRDTQLTLKMLDPSFHKEFPDAFHFVVADKVAFRSEIEHDTKNAVGCANDPTFAGKLSELFEIYSRHTTPVVERDNA